MALFSYCVRLFSFFLKFYSFLKLKKCCDVTRDLLSCQLWPDLINEANKKATKTVLKSTKMSEMKKQNLKLLHLQDFLKSVFFTSKEITELLNQCDISKRETNMLWIVKHLKPSKLAILIYTAICSIWSFGSKFC